MTKDLAFAFMERPHCRVTYRVRPARSGRWIVFLHGAGMDGSMFDAQLAQVPDEYGILCWDARGHGTSVLVGAFRYDDMLDDLRALLVEVGARRLTVVGQSMGGNLAQSYLDAYPGEVERLVLIDCTANHGALSFVEKYALRSTRAVLRMYPWRLTVSQSADACGATNETKAYAERQLRSMGRDRFIEVMDFWQLALRPDPDYRFPVEVSAIVGELDRTGNIRRAMHRLAATDPRVTLTTLAGAAHNSNMDRPAEVNQVIFGSLP